MNTYLMNEKIKHLKMLITYNYITLTQQLFSFCPLTFTITIYSNVAGVVV